MQTQLQQAQINIAEMNNEKMNEFAQIYQKYSKNLGRKHSKATSIMIKRQMTNVGLAQNAGLHVIGIIWLVE